MSTFQFNHENFRKIVLGLPTFRRADAEKGKKFLMTVKGNGTNIDVKDKTGAVVGDEDGVVLRKRIFNVQANSEIALANPEIQARFKEANKLSKAGSAVEAHKMFNDLRNDLQVSFSIMLPNKKADQITDNTEISAKLELITTPNGSLITIDPKSITIMEPEVATAMSLPDGWNAEEDEENTEAIKEDADAVLMTA